MINWRYIKGLNENNGASPLYTFLLFCWKRNSTLAHFDNVPELKYSETNDITANLINPANASNSWGHIITQKATNQSIDTAFTFNSTVTIKDNIYLTGGKTLYLNGTTTASNYINYSSSLIQIAGNTKVTGTFETTGTTKSGGKLTVQSGGAQIVAGGLTVTSGDITANSGSASFSGTTYSGGKLTVNSGGAAITGDTVITNGKCQAVYFNATSDKRAKTDIKPLEIDALDLIKRVQLYSFKYKDSDLPSIGILAQDVQDVNIEGFDLVDNKQASGIDMDYMSIHESKLTYILWKAIQEQQKEIDELKAQIKSLTK